jgi:hypothetical protein
MKKRGRERELPVGRDNDNKGSRFIPQRTKRRRK